MRLVACLNIPMLPLQIALSRNPEWRDQPTVITRDDRPSSLITHASKKALAKQVAIGSRYADALSLVPELRSTHIDELDIETSLSEITAILYRFSPEIEPCPLDKESLWINAKGLDSLFGSLVAWQAEIQEALKSIGFFCRLIIGYTRMGTYIATRSHKVPLILESIEFERKLVDAAPLSLIPLSLSSQKILKRLGITNLCDLRALPIDASIKRFGDELRQVLNLFAKEYFIPLQYLQFDDSPEIGKNFDSPLFSLGLIIEELGGLIERVIKKAIGATKDLGRVELVFYFEDGSTGNEIVTFAQPSLDFSKIMKLIELRLSKRQFKEGVVRLLVQGTEVEPRRVQQDFFESKEAELTLEKAFAIMRARLGNEAVVVAKLRPMLLPEDSYVWEPVTRLVKAQGRQKNKHGLQAIRRIYVEPIELTKGINLKRVISKPIYQSGSWWDAPGGSQEYRRYYMFYQNNRGEILWIYKDELTQKYWLQGILD